MKHILACVMASAMALNASAWDSSAMVFSAAGDSKVVVPDSTGFKFKDIKLVKTTLCATRTSRAHAGASLQILFLRMR